MHPFFDYRRQARKVLIGLSGPIATGAVAVLLMAVPVQAMPLAAATVARQAVEAAPIVLAQSRIERKERELAIRRARKERELQERRARKEAEIMERNFARRRGFEDDRRYGRGVDDRRGWQRDNGFAERPYRGPVYRDRGYWGPPQSDWQRDPYRSQQRPPRGRTFFEDDDDAF